MSKYYQVNKGLSNLSGGYRVGVVFIKFCPVPVEVEGVGAGPRNVPPVWTCGYIHRFVIKAPHVVPNNNADVNNYDNSNNHDI